ncbi:MAG: acyl-CoA/acyl-ACP dehydrogenase [Solirubrobacterales bacterium]|nr:acyl-CoA/acyl-ACP dehydrogenase [Solirubrobacterales bacterium]
MTMTMPGPTTELEMLCEAIDRFVRDEIRPVEAALPPEAREIPAEALVGLQAKARSVGFWCLEAPEQYGGGGLSTYEGVLVFERMSKHRFSFPLPGAGVFGYSPPVVLYHGDPEQIERYVVPTIRDGWSSFAAISEPSGGSDPARAIRTRARRSDRGYVLNGRKMWATNADTADYGVVYARTGNEGRSSISAFIVDSNTPGMHVTSVPVLRNHWTTEIAFDDCEIPAENLIGQEGQGFTLAQEWLVRGRLGYAAQAIGVAEEAIRLATDWASERETFGALLATRQGVQFPLADSRVEVNAARWLAWEAAWKDDAGEDARIEASIAKLYGTETGFRVVDRAIQILGGMGVAKESPLEHWFRDLRVSRIVEGASEIHRYLIARDMLGAASLTKKAA